MREGERKGRGGWKDCLQLRCSFDLCTLSIWSRLKCCLNLAIVNWTDSPLTIPPVTWKVQHIMGVEHDCELPVMEVVTYTREGEGGRLKKCLQYPINRMRCWKVGAKVLAVTSYACNHLLPRSLPQCLSHYAAMKGEALGDVITCSDVM